MRRVLEAGVAELGTTHNTHTLKEESIENSLAQKKYIFSAFEGTFNNIELHIITNALRMLGIQFGVLNWISKLLFKRKIYSTLRDSRIMRKVGRGILQGGVSSSPSY